MIWKCIGHNPTKWGYGNYDKENNTLNNITAIVERKDNGQWSYSVYGKDYLPGIEPSRILAMRAVEVHLYAYGDGDKLDSDYASWDSDPGLW